jgi:hypothetical protein
MEQNVGKSGLAFRVAGEQAKDFRSKASEEKKSGASYGRRSSLLIFSSLICVFFGMIVSIDTSSKSPTQDYRRLAVLQGHRDHLDRPRSYHRGLRPQSSAAPVGQE